MEKPVRSGRALIGVVVGCLLLMTGAAAGKDRDSRLTVTTQAGPHGRITPPAARVAAGERARFTVLPEEGYAAMVSGCNGAVSGTTYTTAPVTRNCRVRATFLRLLPPNKEM